MRKLFKIIILLQWIATQKVLITPIRLRSDEGAYVMNSLVVRCRLTVERAFQSLPHLHSHVGSSKVNPVTNEEVLCNLASYWVNHLSV